MVLMTGGIGVGFVTGTETTTLNSWDKLCTKTVVALKA